MINVTLASSLYPAMESLNESLAFTDAEVTSTQENTTNDLNYFTGFPSNLTNLDNSTLQGDANGTNQLLCQQIRVRHKYIFD